LGLACEIGFGSGSAFACMIFCLIKHVPTS
jgi:hypothetical protein